jgi:release factor glutamine methyltransferase
MIRQQLANAKARLSSVSSSASLDAQLLLAEVLNVSRAYILAHGEETLTDEQIEAYEGLVRRREAGEPIAYILGRKPFYDREFIVSPDVLIPRPETELLLEWALQIADRDGARTVVDVGTGSGALAVTFAALRPQIKVYAVDVSEAALQVAQENARLNEVQVEFLHGSLLQPLIERNIKADLVMANLPYIARDEVPLLEVSRYEPTLALDGGMDGLDLIRELLRQAPQVCSSGAMILLEIGADQGDAMLRLGQAFAEVELRQDYTGLDRMVRVKL